jgi:hypothetical protein
MVVRTGGKLSYSFRQPGTMPENQMDAKIKTASICTQALLRSLVEPRLYSLQLTSNRLSEIDN